MSTNYVILDCDGGSDDAWALLLLLKAEKEERVRLLGVTICGCGNTDLENATRNMCRILKATGRSDIPIFLGAAEALVSTSNFDKGNLFHGKDGFGDILTDNLNTAAYVNNEHAVIAINRLCRIHLNQVTIIAVAPLTNIALCYSMYGDEFAKNVKQIYIMGGNYQGVGNCTRAAEFNFFSDPEAAFIALEKSKCPITILPWEPCLNDRFFICVNWRFKEFAQQAASRCAAIEILNKVEQSQWSSSEFTGWNPCDAMVVAAFLFDKECIQKASMWHATIDLKGCHTRGQMVLDHLHEVEKYPKNVRVIESLDADFFKNVVQWVASLANLDSKPFQKDAYCKPCCDSKQK